MKCEDCKIEVNWRRRRCDKCGKLLCINCLISDKHFANHHMPWKNETCLTPLALDAAIQPPAEHVQNSDIIPAGKSDSQPRQ